MQRKSAPEDFFTGTNGWEIVSEQNGLLVTYDELPAYDHEETVDPVHCNRHSAIKRIPQWQGMVHPSLVYTLDAVDQLLNKWLWSIGIDPARVVRGPAGNLIAPINGRTLLLGYPWFHATSAYAVAHIAQSDWVLRPLKTLSAGEARKACDPFVWGCSSIASCWHWSPGVDIGHVTGIGRSTGYVLQCVLAALYFESAGPTESGDFSVLVDSEPVPVHQFFFRAVRESHCDSTYRLPVVRGGQLLEAKASEPSDSDC